MIDRFIARFNKDEIAVLHSKLSIGERYDEWNRIKENKANIMTDVEDLRYIMRWNEDKKVVAKLLTLLRNLYILISLPKVNKFFIVYVGLCANVVKYGSTLNMRLFPWYFLFLTGYFLYRFMQKNGLLQKLPDVHIAPLEWIGKHSLLLYLLHQPVIYGVLNLMLQT